MKAITILFLILMSCINNKPAGDKELTAQEFDRQGHRGCRGLMPENTIPAMLTALDLGVTTLEMDVVITKDKQVVLSHEPFFNHEISTKPDGSKVSEQEEKSLNIYQMTYDEVKRFDVGLKPHPRFPRQQKTAAYKPLLSDLFDSVAHHLKSGSRPQPYFNIETKSLHLSDGVYHPAPAEFVELLMAVIQKKGVADRVIIQSFDFRTLQYLHEKYPHIKTALLIEGTDRRGIEQQLQSLGFQPTIYSPHASLVNQQLLQYCHERNIRVIPWTVNTKEEIQKLREMGVDGIITDYPDLF
jgi:glycerophosphoryl diester phosphodiesterase